MLAEKAPYTENGKAMDALQPSTALPPAPPSFRLRGTLTPSAAPPVEGVTHQLMLDGMTHEPIGARLDGVDASGWVNITVRTRANVTPIAARIADLARVLHSNADDIVRLCQEKPQDIDDRLGRGQEFWRYVSAYREEAGKAIPIKPSTYRPKLSLQRLADAIKRLVRGSFQQQLECYEIDGALRFMAVVGRTGRMLITDTWGRRRLGSGTYGRVDEVIRLDKPDEPYAEKTTRLLSSHDKSLVAVSDAQFEALILPRIRGPGIQEPHLSCVVWPAGTVATLLTKQYPLGSLEKVIKEGKVSSRRCLRLVETSLQGINTLFQHRVHHNDIKPGNMLVTGAWEVVFCDFAMSRVIRRADWRTNGTPVELYRDSRTPDNQTRIYTYWVEIPDVVMSAMAACSEDTKPEDLDTHWLVLHKSDMLSLGLSLWELLTDHTFPAEDERRPDENFFAIHPDEFSVPLDRQDEFARRGLATRGFGAIKSYLDFILEEERGFTREGATALAQLISEMIDPDSSGRPTAPDALARFTAIKAHALDMRGYTLAKSTLREYPLAENFSWGGVGSKPGSIRLSSPQIGQRYFEYTPPRHMFDAVVLDRDLSKAFARTGSQIAALEKILQARGLYRSDEDWARKTPQEPYVVWHDATEYGKFTALFSDGKTSSFTARNPAILRRRGVMLSVYDKAMFLLKRHNLLLAGESEARDYFTQSAEPAPHVVIYDPSRKDRFLVVAYSQGELVLAPYTPSDRAVRIAVLKAEMANAMQSERLSRG